MSDAYPLAGEIVFVKAADGLGDEALFEALGLSIDRELPWDAVEELDLEVLGLQWASVARSPPWVHFCDGIAYTFFHLPDRDQRLERLAARFDLFDFVFSDPDQSYEYRAYVGGRRVRWRLVISPDFSNRVVRHDLGQLLPGETRELHECEDRTMLEQIAPALGITFDLPREGIRSYAYSVQPLGPDPRG